MKISVIVPMYNSIQTIDKLINSVTCQTYEDYELILVDDGSSDGTYDYVKDITKDNDKIKVYNKTNSGPGLTRKLGFEKSTGDLLFFVDSDDWVTSNDVFEKINLCFKENIDILFFDREDIIGDKKEIIKGFEFLSQGLHSINEINEKIIPGLGAKIFKKDLFEGEYFIDSNIFEDLYATYKYMEKCSNFYYLEDSLYTIFHEENSNSYSSKIDIEKIIKAVTIIIDLENNLDNEELKKSLKLRLPELIYIFISKSIKNCRKNKLKDIDLTYIRKACIYLYNNGDIIYFEKLKGLKKIIYKFFIKKFGV